MHLVFIVCVMCCGTGVVFGGVSAGCHLCGGGGGKDQDVRAGRILRSVELRRLQVERGAAAEH